MIKSKNKNYKYFLLLFFIVSLLIYFICLVADFLIHRLDLWQMRDRNKIFYEMKTSARDEGFKSANFKPVLWPKLELSQIHKDQIIHVAHNLMKKFLHVMKVMGLSNLKMIDLALETTM